MELTGSRGKKLASHGVGYDDLSVAKKDSLPIPEKVLGLFCKVNVDCETNLYLVPREMHTYVLLSGQPAVFIKALIADFNIFREANGNSCHTSEDRDFHACIVS